MTRTTAEHAKKIKPIFGPGWADIYHMCVLGRTRAQDGSTVDNGNKSVFPVGQAQQYAHKLLHFLAGIHDVPQAILDAAEHGIIDSDSEMLDLLSSVNELSDLYHDNNPVLPPSNVIPFSFVDILNKHIDNRRKTYQLLGTGYPCLVFVDYHEQQCKDKKYCVVSLSGHESAVHPFDDVGLISKFFKLFECLVGLFNHRNRMAIENNHIPEYLFLDHESKNYSQFIAMLSDNAAEHPAKSCAEKKAFSYLLKCNYQGTPICISGFQAIQLHYDYFDYPLNRKKRRNKMLVYTNTDQTAGYRLTLLNMCTECVCNAQAYKSTIDIVGRQVKKLDARIKKQKVSGHRRKVKKKKPRQTRRKRAHHSSHADFPTAGHSSGLFQLNKNSMKRHNYKAQSTGLKFAG
jgi:hypothetical protein